MNSLKNICVFCGREIVRTGRKYCNQMCHTKHKRQTYIENWLAGKEAGWFSLGKISARVRNYLIETRGAKCERCGWCEKNPHTGKVPVEIHHNDGDCKNTVPENLVILCPNCHALTSTFRALNIGNGRKYRRVGPAATAAVL